MAVQIDGVQPGSIAEKMNIQAGDRLLAINGHPIRDLLDYGFRTAERKLSLDIQKAGGAAATLSVKKPEYADLGLIFGDFLMDAQHTCQNACIFCFIDQMPKGLRETLYFKDDDERLSYLFGNYITLTNLGDEEIARIIEMRITPINISVHTTNPDLRVRMMGNRFAGEKLRYLKTLADAGIEINGQLVLCRGVNDGAELERTLRDLSVFFPALQSVAVVPVGLTGCRKGLFPLRAFDRASALAVLSSVEATGRRFRENHGREWCYAADEWYLLAEREIPPLAAYDDLLQLENGVGMLALLRQDFLDAAEQAAGDPSAATDLITGQAASGFITRLLLEAKRKFPRLQVTVHTVENRFFGGMITVAGLLTGRDIKRQVPPEHIRGDRILIPRSVLRDEGDLLLDGVSLGELKAYYQKEIIPLGGGSELFRGICGMDFD